MPKSLIPLLGLIVLAEALPAQPAARIADHVVWERDYENLSVSVTGAAVADPAAPMRTQAGWSGHARCDERIRLARSRRAQALSRAFRLFVPDQRRIT